MPKWRRRTLRTDSVVRDEFPKLANGTNSTERLSSAELIKEYAENLTMTYIDWYNRRGLHCGRVAMSLRWISSFLIVIGSMIAVGRLLDPNTQAGIMGSFSADAKVVPAEMGLVLFAAAAGLLVADRFANLSANWLRYRIAHMSLHRRLVEFQIEWARITLLGPEAAVATESANVVGMDASSVPPMQERLKPDERYIERKLDLVREFLIEVFELTEQECNEWAKQFTQSQSELAQYLKMKQIEPLQAASRRRSSGGR
jgi:hypothetical protein